MGVALVGGMQQGMARLTAAHDKALRINLDPVRYGTFAEIGAGQEVARWFFRVGGAAGTIAKSVSAYDMAVSDAIYGHAARYVSRERLEAMLDHELGLNQARLGEARGSATAFFAFADTVSAASYRGNRECHGWMGVKFQSHPRDQASRILIHVRMLDRENALQQEALGVLGVNLLYGAFFHFHEPEQLIESLLDGLGTRRIEIDMVEFSGIEFRHVDNRLMSMKLVELGLSGAAMFGASGQVLQPSEVLHKRPVLLARGSFRPVAWSHLDILRSARQTAFAEDSAASTDVLELCELTLRNLRGDRAPSQGVDRQDFLLRADMLAAVGKTVLISDYFEFERLAAFIGRYTKGQTAFVVGAGTLPEIFGPNRSGGNQGEQLEAVAQLFRDGLKLYVYPLRDAATGALTTAESYDPGEPLRGLYRYVLERGLVQAVSSFTPEHLPIFSRDVLARIGRGAPGWEEQVPPEVEALIRERRAFGYQPQNRQSAA
jgi:hypothetical protein